jgi:hypothetical protein
MVREQEGEKYSRGVRPRHICRLPVVPPNRNSVSSAQSISQAACVHTTHLEVGRGVVGVKRVRGGDERVDGGAEGGGRTDTGANQTLAGAAVGEAAGDLDVGRGL